MSPSDSARTGPLLVLGLGNVLCRDDGVGVVAVTRLLRRYRVPEGAMVLDGGTLGLSLLPHLQAAADVILVDAVAFDDAPAGALVKLEGDAVLPAVEQRLSPHQVGVCDLLDGARLLGGDGAQRILLVGVVPERIELGTGLTPRVAAAVDDLVETVVLEASVFGYELSRYDGEERADGGAGDRAARVLGM